MWQPVSVWLWTTPHELRNRWFWWYSGFQADYYLCYSEDQRKNPHINVTLYYNCLEIYYPIEYVGKLAAAGGFSSGLFVVYNVQEFESFKDNKNSN